jgi:hypothetical protein
MKIEKNQGNKKKIKLTHYPWIFSIDIQPVLCYHIYAMVDIYQNSNHLPAIGSGVLPPRYRPLQPCRWPDNLKQGENNANTY